MYYDSGGDTGDDLQFVGEPSSPHAALSNLKLTPSVALRVLTEQIQHFEALLEAGSVQPSSHALLTHFSYPLPPPGMGVKRSVHDPVLDAIADYASKVLALQGLFVAGTRMERLDRTARQVLLTRELFAFEHALAMGIAQLFPNSSLVLRENASKGTLAIAAFWCDRHQLVFAKDGFSHHLLGERPTDERGQVLYDYAIDALDLPHNLRFPESEEFIDLRNAVRQNVDEKLA